VVSLKIGSEIGGARFDLIGFLMAFLRNQKIDNKPPLRKWVEICVASSISNNEEASPVS
jgi:hypothetical protein